MTIICFYKSKIFRRTLDIPQCMDNLQERGNFTWRVSDCEELFLSSAGIEQLSHCFDLNSQNHY